MIQLCFREIGFLVTTKRYVKFSAQIVTTQTVVSIPVQVQEQHRTPKRIPAFVELFTKLVVNLSQIGLWREKLTRSPHILIGTCFYNVVKADEITVDIGKDITRKVGVKKHRPGTHKGFNQAFTLWQMPFYIFKQGYFPLPTSKKRDFFHADLLITPSPAVEKAPTASCAVVLPRNRAKHQKLQGIASDHFRSACT